MLWQKVLIPQQAGVFLISSGNNLRLPEEEEPVKGKFLGWAQDSRSQDSPGGRGPAQAIEEPGKRLISLKKIQSRLNKDWRFIGSFVT